MDDRVVVLTFQPRAKLQIKIILFDDASCWSSHETVTAYARGAALFLKVTKSQPD
jgi:hypothetical protein